MRSLSLTFKTAANKTKTLRLSAYSGDLTPDVAQKFMTALIDADQFYRDGVKQYATPVSARMIDTTSQDIWTADATA
ncbi:DUF2922 domain-containing protein [Lacticaseibacillus thailandensis]|uniref:DUF2922 domain-containing protein n=1 Tax=Lacticaseibacillus thailandensis DSM 22698 = JCM 13996 TaxID=1423810 RepID=A0A0R2C7R4_9LACO|nr:DUF2922 domain-containing protein [Lacticaseibacillus thailandensis]KRM87774.1 hypothetical protein FD19_GL000049 [Lacticaseibacillus thailandensis DSM 22698 = JCM 13996]